MEFSGCGLSGRPTALPPKHESNPKIGVRALFSAVLSAQCEPW
jgi:hypothetical protein